MRQDRTYRCVVALGTLFLRLMAVRITVRGAEHLPRRGHGILAISHFSYLDFVLVQWAVWRHRRRYTRFMATAPTFRHRISGRPMRAMGHIPVDRGAGASGYRLAEAAVRRGELIGVFPETRVSRSFTLLQLKRGAATLALRTGAPLVPCIVWGSHRIMTRTHRTTLWRSRHLPVEIAFGAPLPVSPSDDAATLTARLRAAMEQLLDEAQDRYPGGTGEWWQPAHRGGAAPTAEEGLLLDGLGAPSHQG